MLGFRKNKWDNMRKLFYGLWSSPLCKVLLLWQQSLNSTYYIRNFLCTKYVIKEKNIKCSENVLRIQKELYITQGTFLCKLGIAILWVSNASLWLLYRALLSGASFTNFTYNKFIKLSILKQKLKAIFSEDWNGL